jgi:HK97 family phage major capsid protein
LLLTAEKVAAIYPASNEYLADANIDVLAAIIEIFGEQFGIQEDTMGISDQDTVGVGMLYYGDGTLAGQGDITANGAIGQFRGQSSSSGKTSFPQMGDAAGTLDFWLDLLTFFNSQPSALFQGGQIWLPQEVVTALLSMRDSNHRPLANLDMGFDLTTGLDGQPQLTFQMYPVIVVPSGIMITYSTSASASTPFACMLNPMRAWMCMGIRGGFEVDMSISATADSINAFTNDLKLFRLKERVSFGCGRPNTITVLRTSAT